MDIMRQSACLGISHIADYSDDLLFNCITVGLGESSDLKSSIGGGGGC